ncbi:MAG TPA: ATP-binding protein [Terracidiphilus sp.]|nr:ATP-binding protein [Terracidiphilus sp.]HEV2398014.1 ATP-binding protein [Candidatus Sulfotelmatobacter sp.]
MSSVFEAFYRVDPSRFKDTGGYGLGLSICKRITEGHPRMIQSERNHARGSSFLLVFRDLA